MGKTVIISDIHLREDDQTLWRMLELFTQRLPSGTRLIIAGDLFDFYIGLNPADPVCKRLAGILSHISRRGIFVDFLSGNRDFLMSERDAAFFSMRVLPEYELLYAGQKPVLLIHGDELCGNDRSFQRFRALGHNRFARALFLSLPFSLRKRIALSIRNKSKRADPSRKSAPSRYGMVKSCAESLMRKYGVSTLIYGHFHHFSDISDSVFNGSRMLCLGCWGQKFSYAIVGDGGIRTYELNASELYSDATLPGLDSAI